MNRLKAPEIEVGIIKAPTIRFRMDGEFRTGAGGAFWLGNAEATVINKALVIRQEETETLHGASVIFTPVDQGSSRFSIEDVVIGIGFHWEQKEQQEFQGTFMGAEFQGIGLVAYDKVAGHYQSVWMDSMSTGMMYETGEIDETGKVFTFEGTYNDPMSGGVVEMRTVHTIESPDRHVVAMYHTGPGEEFKMGELVYTRR